MKIKPILLLIILCLCAVSGFSQKKIIRKTEKRYDNYAYIDVIKVYEKIAEKGYKDEKMFERLGNSYYFNADYDKAEGAYRELFAMSEDQKPEVYYRYAQSLKSTG